MMQTEGHRSLRLPINPCFTSSPDNHH
jgi:hypothetical protein